MSRLNFVETDGKVIGSLDDGSFKVRLNNGHELIATLSGRLRLNQVAVCTGDHIMIHVSPYDLSTGHIVWRYND